LKDKAVRIIKHIAIIALIIVLGLQCLPMLDPLLHGIKHGISRNEWRAFSGHVQVYMLFYGFASTLPELEVPEASILESYGFVLNTNAPTLYTSTVLFSDSTAILVQGDGNESDQLSIGYYAWICIRSGRCRLFEISPQKDKYLESHFFDINELILPRNISETDDIDSVISICWNHFRGITNEFVSVRPYYRFQRNRWSASSTRR
jgi:hypothetical protein